MIVPLVALVGILVFALVKAWVSLSPQAVVVHLAGRADRRENVETLVCEGQRAGFDISVFDAVDGRRFNVRQVDPFLDFSLRRGGGVRNHLRGGEQGCLESFLIVMRGPASSALLYLEDDATVSGSSMGRFRHLVDQYRDMPYVFLGFRSHPRFQSPPPEGLEDWVQIRSPNYSNSCVAFTPEARRQFKRWVVGVPSVPADDLLSIACGVHLGTRVEPMLSSWRGVAPGPLTAWAPRVPLSGRIASESDTEPASTSGPGGSLNF